MVENLLGEQEQGSLRLRTPLPLACHPAEVYLDSLAPGSVSSGQGRKNCHSPHEC